MLADDGSAADIERRREPAINAEPLRANGGADDVDDGIYGADFMKMHALDGDSMDRCLDLSQQLKRSQ